jgi:hypothetical protein
MKRMLTPAVGFLGLTAVMAAAGLARRSGLLDATVTFRILGACIGLMAVVTGNFLPKMRPLGAGTLDSERAAAAERRAGWLLVLMGLALVGLFVFAPPALARWVSSLVALAGVGLIELDWIWTAWTARSASGEAARPQSAAARERRTLAKWLLFGLAYVLVTASLKFITSDSQRFRELTTWSVVGFAITFSVLYALLDFRRRGWDVR